MWVSQTLSLTLTITFESDADISRFVLDKREYTLPPSLSLNLFHTHTHALSLSQPHVYNLDYAGQVKCYMMGLVFVAAICRLERAMP